MNRALQGRGDSENPRGLGKQVVAINAPVCRALLCYIALIAGQEKRSSGRPLGSLHLQQALAACPVDGQYIVARPISALSGNPSHLLGQVRTFGVGKLSALGLL
jgi:hypothetical protein